MGIMYFILTRFNLRLWTNDKVGRECRTDLWLKERFGLFEKYCMPSVIGQCCKNFCWIVLFDEETPKQYVDRFWEYRDRCPQFQPLLVKKDVSARYELVFRHFIKKKVDEYIDDNGLESVKCITTWFDNDDAINKDFVGAVQDYVGRECGNNEVVYFEKGLQYVESLGCPIEYRYDRNHFVSMVEKYKKGVELKTVFFMRTHVGYDESGYVKIHVVKDERLMWLEVNHAHNVMNEVSPKKTWKLIKDANVMKEFSLEMELSGWRYVNYVFRFFPMLFVEGVKRLWKRRLGGGERQD